MKLVLKYFVAVALFVISLSTIAYVKPIKVHNDTGYITMNNEQSMTRYSFTAQDFLSPLEFDMPIAMAHVDDSGYYIVGVLEDGSYPLYHYDTNQQNKRLLANLEELPAFIDDLGDMLVLSGPYGFSFKHIYVVDKQNGGITDDIAAYLPMKNDRLITDIEGKVAVDKGRRTIYFITDSSNNNDTYLRRATIDENGIFDLDLSVLYDGDRGRLFSADSLDYVVTGYGEVFSKEDFSGITTLIEANDQADNGFFNHFVHRFEVYNQLIVSFASGKVNLFDANGSQLNVIDIPRPILFGVTQFGTVFENEIHIITFDYGRKFVDVINMTDLLPRPSIPVDPNTLTYTPDYSAIDKDGDIVYMFAVGQFDIFRWSLSQQQYLTPITLTALADRISYSASQHKIYVAYGKRLNVIDVSAFTETRFTDLPYVTKDLHASDNFVIAVDQQPGGSTELVRAFDLSGNAGLTSSINTWEDLVISDKLNRIYLMTNIGSKWIELSASAEKIDGETVFDGTPGIDWLHASVSDNGELIASSSGDIVSANNFTEQASYGLPNNSQSNLTAWLHGNLFTLAQVDTTIAYSVVIRYQADFSENSADSFSIEGTPIAVLPNPQANQLVIITLNNSTPEINTYSVTAEDFDEDGADDLADEYPVNPFLQAFTPTTFMPFSSIEKWTYGDGVSAVLGDTKTIAGRVIQSIEFSTGSQLLFDTSNDELTFHGYYLPKLDVLGSEYAVDLQLTSPVTFSKRGGDFSGEGKVFISPEFGEQSFTWSASVDYLADSVVPTNSSQDYHSIGFSIQLDAITNIDSVDIAVEYSADLYFAEGIGLVRIDEKNGADSRLESFTRVNETGPEPETPSTPTTPDPATPSPSAPTPEASSGSSGGSSSLISLAFILLVVFRRYGAQIKLSHRLLHKKLFYAGQFVCVE